jgi:hypothetical protein
MGAGRGRPSAAGPCPWRIADNLCVSGSGFDGGFGTLAGMTDDELQEQVRALRAKRLSPKQVARVLGVPPAVAARAIRAIATADAATLPDPADRELRACWVSPGWSTGLTVDGHPDWPDIDEPEPGHSGIAAVLVARDAGRSRLSVCGYLVDVYCLGVKNVFGPRVMSAGECADFTRQFFGAFDEPPIAAPLDLAQHLVLGAVDFARSLGVEPVADFEGVKGHLGPWDAPSAIGFGLDGKPYYVEGPYDDTNQILRQLERSAGRDNFTYLVGV